MRKSLSLLVFVLVLCVSASAWAFDFDFDDLFGDNLLVDFTEDEVKIKPEEALLVQDGLDLGGSYRLSVNASRSKLEGMDPRNSLSASLGGHLYLDARPNLDFRVFGKLGFTSNVSKRGETSDSSVKLNLVELFFDFNYENQVFFRAGKQNVKWGVGYFFSPADVITTGRIDPLEPEAEREGPVALKIHYPKKSTNYYLYALFDGVTEPDGLALAPKVEFVLGRSEIGLGAFYQKDKAPRLSATVSSSLGSLALFGEAVVSKGSDKYFAGEGSPLDYPIHKSDQLFFHATGGAMYSYSDPDKLFNITTALQYYFNGEGYQDQKQIQRLKQWYGLLQLTDPEKAKNIRVSDFRSTGRHYAAAMVGWNNILDSKFSASALWNGNLSDKSGLVSASLSLPNISKISPSVGVSFTYGEAGSEYGLGVKNATVFLAVTLGSGSF